MKLVYTFCFLIATLLAHAQTQIHVSKDNSKTDTSLSGVRLCKDNSKGTYTSKEIASFVGMDSTCIEWEGWGIHKSEIIIATPRSNLQICKFSGADFSKKALEALASLPDGTMVTCSILYLKKEGRLMKYNKPISFQVRN